MNQEEIDKYVAHAFFEELIRGHENQLLELLKQRTEKFPSKEHDNEWLTFSNWVCKRRYER